MKMISDRSLVCFLHDLRQLLVYFKSQLPEYVDFINIESFYFYMRLGFPRKSKELAALMDIIEPFIPMIISPKNLEEVVIAYEQGNPEQLAALEKSFMGRSKFIFMNTVMEAEGADWENILSICLKIWEIKSRQLTFV